MKLLIISYIFPPYSTGAGTVMYNLCRNLPAVGYIAIAASDGLAYRQGTYDNQLVLRSKIIKMPVYSTKHLDQILFCWMSILKTSLIDRRERTSCILAVYPYFYDLVAGYILHKLLRKPLYVYMHDLFIELRRKSKLHSLWFYLEKKILSSATKVLVMNENYVDHYTKRGITNLALLPPSIDLETYNSTPNTNRFARSSKKLRISYTGSVYSAQEDAVLSFLETTKQINDVEVVFATPNNMAPLKSQLTELLKEVNVGFIPKRDCVALQRSSDVLFLPLSGDSSLTEELKVAFPSKMLDYLAAGKPVLAVVPKGSFVERLINENRIGVVVNELSTEKIEAAISLLRNPQLRAFFARNAIETIKQFDSKIVAKQLLKIVQEDN